MLWPNNCSGRVQFSVGVRGNEAGGEGRRLSSALLECQLSKHRTYEKTGVFFSVNSFCGNSNFLPFRFDDKKITERKLFSPGFPSVNSLVKLFSPFAYIREKQKSARSLNIKFLSFLRTFSLLIFINLIFIFVYIKQHKFLLSSTEKFATHMMGNRGCVHVLRHVEQHILMFLIHFCANCFT